MEAKKKVVTMFTYEPMVGDARDYFSLLKCPLGEVVFHKLSFCDEVEKRLTSRPRITSEIFVDLWSVLLYVGLPEPFMLYKEANNLRLPLEYSDEWVESMLKNNNRWVHIKYREFLIKALREVSDSLHKELVVQ